MSRPLPPLPKSSNGSTDLRDRPFTAILDRESTLGDDREDTLERVLRWRKKCRSDAPSSDNIPSTLEKYVSRESYDRLDERGREIYMMGMMDIWRGTQENITPKVIPFQPYRRSFSMDVTFVGNHYLGGHVFQHDDVITLKCDEDPNKPYRIMVMAERNYMPTCVALVALGDAITLRQHGKDIESATVMYLWRSTTSARYRITIR